MELPQTLDVGDGLTIDRDLALEATRHVLIALKLIVGQPTLHDAQQCRYEGWMFEQAVSQVAFMLGGDDWLQIADQLVVEAFDMEVG